MKRSHHLSHLLKNKKRNNKDLLIFSWVSNMYIRIKIKKRLNGECLKLA